MNVASLLRTRELGVKASAPKLKIDRDGAGEVRVRWWTGAQWERVWAHQRYRCDGSELHIVPPECGFFLGAEAPPPTPVGVVQSRSPPRRLACAGPTASRHETALHYLVGCGDVEAVERAVHREWAFGAVLDENVDFFSMKEEDISEITAFAIDTEATTKECREDLGRDEPEVTAMDVLLANEVNWPGRDRSVEMVGVLLNGRPPTAELLWKARKNPCVARELIRRGAPHHTDAVVGVVPEQWRKYMADSPFTMLAHAFWEALWGPGELYHRSARAKDLCGFIDALLDAGEHGYNGNNYDRYSWDIMFWEPSARTCLRSRLCRALDWDSLQTVRP